MNPCKWSTLRRLALLIGIVVILGLAGGVIAAHRTPLRFQMDDPMRAAWLSTDFQVVNLAPDTQPILVHFWGPGGTEVYSLTDVLAGGGSRFYDVTNELPPGFVGTLVLETPVGAALGVLHLEEAPVGDGSTVLDGVNDDLLNTSSYFPIDSCIALRIHNLSPDLTATVELLAYDQAGTWAGFVVLSIGPLNTVSFYPVLDLPLPPDFVGSGVIQADLPVEVTVIDLCDGWGSYVAANDPGPLLLLPRIQPELPPLVTTTISIQNPSPGVATGEVSYSSGANVPFTLPPLGAIVLHSPFTDTVGSAVISADQPLAAVCRTASSEPGASGTYAYPAFRPEQATLAASLPVLFNGYEGWETGDRIWVQNTAALPAEVRIRYVTAPTGTVYWDQAVVDPLQVAVFSMPEMPAQRAAAILLSDQPIIAGAGALQVAPPGNPWDRQIHYRATNFDFQVDPVHDVGLIWDPPAPTVGQEVTFTGSAQGTPPIDYTWDLGDGTLLQGEVVSHTYDLAGDYTVVLTATNGLGFGVAGTAGILTVQEQPCEPVSGLELNWLPLTPTVGEQVTFSAVASGTLPISYSWDLGDGTLLQGAVVDHSYDLPGDYTITLTATNCLGTGVATATRVLVVAASPCEPAYGVKLSWIPLTPTVGEQVTFSATASGTLPISYSWDLGDGTGATGVVVNHTYSFPGSYLVSLTATNACGGASISDTITVVYLPCDGVEILAVYTDVSGCVVTFSADLSGDEPFAYQWDFGAFGSSTAPTPTVDFVGDGTYPYSLLVSNCAGAHTDTYAGVAAVACGVCAPVTQTGFAWAPPSPVVGEVVTLSGAARGSTPITFTWDLGDGALAAGAVVSHTYDLPGVYTVTLTATNCLGLGQDTASQSLTVTTKPGWTVYLPLLVKNLGP